MTRHRMSVERDSLGGHYYRCSCGWGIADDWPDYKERIAKHTNGSVVLLAGLFKKAVHL